MRSMGSDPSDVIETVGCLYSILGLTRSSHLQGTVGFPSWCKAHPATCLVLLGLVTLAFVTFGGIEGMEEAANRGPEDRDNGK
jgi:hypothetical protein